VQPPAPELHAAAGAVDKTLCAWLLQVCNHPHLSYVQPPGADAGELPRRCGKLAALDRMLVKLHATGHRVLLFSTMTRLLDLLEVPSRRK